MLQRTSDSSGITFDGYSEKVINGSSTTTSKFYSLNGMRLALRQSSTLSYLLPDLLGSPTVALSSTGSFQAVQLFSPYGTSRYSSGSMPTDYNFTGQRLDSETGLIYENFRYYDPVSGRFVRADTVDTNARGMDGYGYVGDNPEGRTDPTGHCWPLCTMIIGAVIGAAVSVATTAITSAVQGKTPTAGQLLQAAAVGAVTGAITGLVGPEAGPIARIAVGAVANGAGQMVGNAISGKPLMDGVVQATITGAITGGLIEGAGALFKGFSGEATEALEGTTCSFTFDTRVATAHGKQAIGKLYVGEKVLAYNPKTHKMELQPILHVWINHDNDLVDLTLTTTLKTRQGHGVSRQSELIHTNQKHPFFTQEQGFLAVGQLKLGMHVLRADGLWGVVTGWKIVPGSRTMYNLEVAQDHTFTVGADEWVVHNDCGTFTNHYPDKLPGELARAEQLGVKPIQAGGPGFQEMIQNGWVKWAVTEDGQLAFIPKFVNGEEIPHTVITGGEDVLAAGEAKIYNNGNGYTADQFNYWSGHYQPDEASSVIGQDAFINNRITFPPPIIGLRW